MTDWLRTLVMTANALVIAFLGGAAVSRFEVWPHGAIASLMDVVAFDEASNTGVVERLRRGWATEPRAVLVEVSPAASAGRDLRAPAFQARRQPLSLTLTRPQMPGFLVVAGAFDFTDGQFGAVLIGPDGTLLHSWTISEAGLDWGGKPDAQIFLHGFAPLPDGSVLASFDQGTSLQRVDVCSNRVWAQPGAFHHAITVGDVAAWALQSRRTLSKGQYQDAIVRFDLDTGNALSAFSITDLIAANPDLDIFGIRQDDYYRASEWAADPFHTNDVDPLPQDLADAFEMFAAGDLLLSLRSLNLIVVVDPDTLAVKWWRSSAWRRQHDPDWLPDGRIAVYDNNMHRGPARIVAIDPASNTVETLLDGAAHDFTAPIRGRVDIRGGDILVTSAQQGRVFAVGEAGETWLDLRNLFDDKRALLVSDARFLPLDFFDGAVWERCAPG